MTKNSQAFRVVPEGLELYLKVTPNAAHHGLIGIVVRDDGEQRLHIRVGAAPDKGKANKAVIALLAKRLGVPKSKLTIVSGQQARNKSILVQTENAEDLIEKLTAC